MRLKTLVEQIDNKKDVLDKLLDTNTLRLNKLYAKAGYELRIVGGAVRDILSKKEPKDIDLASDATPQESMELLKSQNIKVIETGLDHGTIVAHIDGEDYEITTLRIDVETDGRHADVEFTKDWETDAARRDLTFNAMSMDFNGNLYDYFGGQDDLEAGNAKFVGDADGRVQEDYLRILRYFRFQARVDSPKFEPATLKSMKSNASGLDGISGERMWSEMGKILGGKHLALTLKHMKSTNVLDHIGLANAANPMKVKSNTDDPVLLLASMLKGTEELDTLRARWKFSNPEYKLMRFIFRHRNNKVSFTDAKRMHVMDNDDKSHLVKLFEYQGKHDIAAKLRDWEVPEFPVNGRDLMNKGLTQGIELGNMKDTLKDKWVKSGFEMSKDELLKIV